MQGDLQGWNQYDCLSRPPAAQQPSRGFLLDEELRPGQHQIL